MCLFLEACHRTGGKKDCRTVKVTMGRYRLGRQHQLFQNLLEVANEVAPLILDLQIDVTICTFLGEPKATQVGVSQDIPRYPKSTKHIQTLSSKLQQLQQLQVHASLGRVDGQAGQQLLCFLHFNSCVDP